MTTLLRLRARRLATAFAGAALQFGTYDMSGQTPAGKLIEGEYFIEAYAGGAADRADPDIYPAPHGFTLHPTPMARAALDDIESWLADRFVEA
jgi:hypothetical protein